MGRGSSFFQPRRWKKVAHWETDSSFFGAGRMKKSLPICKYVSLPPSPHLLSDLRTNLRSRRSKMGEGSFVLRGRRSKIEDGEGVLRSSAPKIENAGVLRSSEPKIKDGSVLQRWKAFSSKMKDSRTFASKNEEPYSTFILRAPGTAFEIRRTSFGLEKRRTLPCVVILVLWSEDCVQDRHRARRDDKLLWYIPQHREQQSWMCLQNKRTCQTQNPDITTGGSGRGAAHGGATERSGAGQNRRPTDPIAQITTDPLTLKHFQSTTDNCLERLFERTNKRNSM